MRYEAARIPHAHLNSSVVIIQFDGVVHVLRRDTAMGLDGN